MVFYDSIWNYYPDTERSTGVYILFIQMHQFSIAHMFRVQLLDIVPRVNKILHALQ